VENKPTSSLVMFLGQVRLLCFWDKFACYVLGQDTLRETSTYIL